MASPERNRLGRLLEIRFDDGDISLWDAADVLIVSNVTIGQNNESIELLDNMEIRQDVAIGMIESPPANSSCQFQTRCRSWQKSLPSWARPFQLTSPLA